MRKCQGGRQEGEYLYQKKCSFGYHPGALSIKPSILLAMCFWLKSPLFSLCMLNHSISQALWKVLYLGRLNMLVQRDDKKEEKDDDEDEEDI